MLAGLTQEQLLEQLDQLFEKHFDRRIKQFEDKVDDAVKSFGKSVDELKQDNRKLKARLNVLESLVLRNSVEIHGIPAESTTKPKDIVLKLARAMNMVELQESHIYSAVRSGLPKTVNGSKTQAITVEFFRQDISDCFLDRTKEFIKQSKEPLTTKVIGTRTKHVPIFVVRKTSPEIKRLRWLALQKKAALGYEFCWISKAGKLCMKKSAESPVISISCEEDIEQLKPSKLLQKHLPHQFVSNVMESATINSSRDHL